jgi:hypothetical protein
MINKRVNLGKVNGLREYFFHDAQANADSICTDDSRISLDRVVKVDRQHLIRADVSCIPFS